MRDKLMNEIICLMTDSGVDMEKFKARLFLILSDYEIELRKTEVAVLDEDATERFVKLFLIGKRVAGRTERTLKCYSDELARFFNEVRKSPLEVTSDDIKMYLAVKEVRDGAGKVYLKHISRVLGSFYTWMQREEYITRNPMNKVDEIKCPKVKKEAFTELQIEQMRMEAEGDEKLSCIFEILLSTWCRVSELAQIKISEISPDMEHVLIHGKGRKDRICYLNARAKIQLQRYLKERTDNNPYLFAKCKIRATDNKKCFAAETKRLGVKPREWWKRAEMVGDGHMDQGTIEAAVRKLGKRTGVENVHPHRFRRTGATFALRKGMPIEQVSKLLGHESIETTQIYLDISERELEQAHKKFV